MPAGASGKTILIYMFYNHVALPVAVAHSLYLLQDGGQQNVRAYIDVHGKRRCVGTDQLKSTQSAPHFVASVMAW